MPASSTGKAAMLSRDLARLLRDPGPSQGQGMIPAMLLKQQISLEEHRLLLSATRRELDAVRRQVPILREEAASRAAGDASLLGSAAAAVRGADVAGALRELAQRAAAAADAAEGSTALLLRRIDAARGAASAAAAAQEERALAADADLAGRLARVDAAAARAECVSQDADRVRADVMRAVRGFFGGSGKGGVARDPGADPDRAAGSFELVPAAREACAAVTEEMERVEREGAEVARDAAQAPEIAYRSNTAMLREIAEAARAAEDAAALVRRCAVAVASVAFGDNGASVDSRSRGNSGDTANLPPLPLQNPPVRNRNPPPQRPPPPLQAQVPPPPRNQPSPHLARRGSSSSELEFGGATDAIRARVAARRQGK